MNSISYTLEQDNDSDRSVNSRRKNRIYGRVSESEQEQRHHSKAKTRDEIKCADKNVLYETINNKK